jgi:DNA topoisomerase-1
MVIRWGRHGEFLACSAYPECKSTKEFTKGEDGKVKVNEVKESNEVCDKCGKPMLVKRGRFGVFLACSGYPACRNTRSMGTGIKCPKCAKGEIVQKGTKRGRSFYGCNKYPACDFAVWDKPIAETCPVCKGPILVEKYVKKTGDVVVMCPVKGCDFKKKPE